jgi:hypothetical protein
MATTIYKKSEYVTSNDSTKGGTTYIGSTIVGENDNGRWAPVIHPLVDTVKHPVADLTTGHFLKALSATTYGFAAHGLTYTDVGAAAVSQSFYFGTTLVAINRESAPLAVTGISSIGIEDGGFIASGDVYMIFDHTNHFLEIIGCTVAIGGTDPAGYTLNVNGTILAVTSITTPTVKLTTGATVGYFWSCTNIDGSGVWASVPSVENYIGTWDANTNTPTLTDGVGTSGDYYHVIVAGTQNLGSGNITFALGDDVWYNGSIWQKVTGAAYVLQTASSSVSGGVIIGSSLQINAGVLNINNYDYGDITVSGTGTDTGRIWTIDAGTVTLAKMADMATASLIYRRSAGTGAPEVNTLAQLKTDLGLTGDNSGDNSVNTLYSGLVSFPGFGTTHTTAAYGDHTHPVSTMSVTNTTDSTCWVSLFEEAAGNMSAKTNAGLQYNASSRLLTVSGTGSGSGIQINNSTVPFFRMTETTLGYNFRLGIASYSTAYSDIAIAGNCVMTCWNTDMIFNSIGTTSPGGFKWSTRPGGGAETTAMWLDSNGILVCYNHIYGLDFCNTSDKRLKNSIKKIKLDRINIEYKEFEFNKNEGQKRYGVIAQELALTNPELVRIDKDGLMSVSYIDLYAIEISQLKQRVSDLEKILK